MASCLVHLHAVSGTASGWLRVLGEAAAGVLVLAIVRQDEVACILQRLASDLA